MHALIVREPWIDLILSGKKTWEMRSKGTAVRGTVALIRKGSGAVCGVVDVVDSLPAVAAAELAATQDRHRIPPAQFEEVARARWLTPWVMARPRPLAQPVRYDHPSGAVTWVRLTPQVADSVLTQLGPANPSAANPLQLATVPADFIALHEMTGHALIRLTEGNLKNNHIYLRTAWHLFPDDAVGGGNKDTVGRRPIRVTFEPGQTVETDIAGDKMILRNRGAVGDFLQRSGAAPGDTVCIERRGEREYVVLLLKTPH